MERSNMDNDTVARRAYERYEERGRENGRDQEDWFAAEQDVRGSNTDRQQAPAPGGSRPSGERMSGEEAGIGESSVRRREREER